MSVAPHRRAALLDAGQRLMREAEVYLATVDLFRAEGLEPKWKSETGALSFRAPHAVDGARALSAAKRTENRK